MSKVPESISIDDLQAYAFTAKREDIILDPARLRREATDLIEKLSAIVQHMETFNPADLAFERRNRFITARRSIKIALRNLRKSIET